MTPARARQGLILTATLAAMTLVPRPTAADCWANCCNNWGEFKRACECAGGRPLPNPARCVEDGGGYTPPPAPVDPRVRQNERYQAIVAGGLVDPGLPIGTEEQFLKALWVLHVRLHDKNIKEKAGADYYNLKSVEAKHHYDDFYKPLFDKFDGDNLIRENVEEERSLKAELSRLSAETNRISDLRARFTWQVKAPENALSLRNRNALSSKKRLQVHIGGLTREEVEEERMAIAPPVARGRPDVVGRPGYYGWGPSTPPRLAAQIEEARKSHQSVLVNIPPELKGDIDSRLTVIEGVQADAAASVQIAAAARRAYEANWANSNHKRIWDLARPLNLALIDRTDKLAAAAIPAAKVELKYARDLFKSDAFEFCYNGAKAGTWDLFRKQHLDPELKRLGLEVFRGNFVLSDAQVEHAWKLGKDPIFPLHGQYSKAKELASLTKLAKAILGTGQDSMLAMATVTGQAEVGDIHRIGDQLTMGLDSATTNELKDSLTTTDLPKPVQNFWRTYFTGSKQP